MSSDIIKLALVTSSARTPLTLHAHMHTLRHCRPAQGLPSRPVLSRFVRDSVHFFITLNHKPQISKNNHSAPQSSQNSPIILLVKPSHAHNVSLLLCMSTCVRLHVCSCVWIVCFHIYEYAGK